MSDINLFQGGQGRGISSDCGCGNLPSLYPSPNRVAAHYKAQRFTLSDQVNLRVNANKRCVLCGLADTVANQTANVIGKKIGLLRVPPRHKVEDLRVVLDPGTNGAGMVVAPYADIVDPVTGALIGSWTIPASAAGPFTLAAGTTVDAFGEFPLNARYSDKNTIEIGFKITTAPAPSATLTTICQFDGHLDLVAKVDGYDYGNE